MEQIKISVIMPVYNTEKYLCEAIESILQQTEKNFELIIIDDASTDSTATIVREYSCKDDRIIFLQNENNMGISKTLNRGIDIARGHYIARMDADDIALPTRLQKQLKYMESHKEIIILGCGLQCFGASEALLGTVVGYHKVKVNLLFNSCLGHPSYMMRADVLNKYRLRYNEGNCYAEDYELLCDAIAYGDIDNYPETLMRYRVHSKSVSREHREIQRESTNKVRAKMLQKLGISLSKDEIEIYGKAANPKPDMQYTILEYKKLIDIYRRIEQINKNKKIYDTEELHLQLKKHADVYKKEVAFPRRWKKRIKSWVSKK